MKRMRFLLGCVVCALAVFAAGCSSGSDSGGSEPENAISMPKYQTNAIIRNKVVSVNGEDSGYYEYLEFETATSGKYYLYKDNALQGEAKDFSYDPATGKFSAGTGETEVHSYMFEAKKNGENVSVIAKDEMICDAEIPELCAVWNVDSLSFSFDEDKVSVKNTETGLEFSVKYSNEDGWVTIETEVDDIPLFYSSSNRFFFLAYDTERSPVSEVGRNADKRGIILESPVFILADIQL